MDYELILNEVALELRDGESTFNALSLEHQKEMLETLKHLAIQAGSKQSLHLEEVLKNTGVPRRSTPAVLLSKNRAWKIPYLPEYEFSNGFLILMELFKIADKERREKRCRGGCNHWWHGPRQEWESAREEASRIRF